MTFAERLLVGYQGIFLWLAIILYLNSLLNPRVDLYDLWNILKMISFIRLLYRNTYICSYLTSTHSQHFAG